MASIRQFVDGEYGQLHLRKAYPEKMTQEPGLRPLFCLHMSPKSGRIFDRFIQAFATDRMAVAPDYPGYGESDAPPAQPHVTICDYARNMWLVADELHIDTIDILGYHTGSLVAAEMAKQQPNRVGRIVMISAPVFTEKELEAMSAYFRFIPLDEAGTRFTKMWRVVQEHAVKGDSLELAAESFSENLRAGENYEWGHRAAFSYAMAFPSVVAAIKQRIDIINPGDDLQGQTLRILPFLQKGAIVDHPQWGHGFLDFDKDNAVKEVRRLLALT